MSRGSTPFDGRRGAGLGTRRTGRRPPASAALTLALVLGGGAAAADLRAQPLAERVRATRDGAVQFQFAAREGVCGWGESISIYGDRPSSDRTSGDRVIRRGEGREGRPCREGPVRVRLRLEDGRATVLDARVGTPWPDRLAGAEDPGAAPDGAADLGSVPPADAADYLLEVAVEAPAEVGEQAVFVATLARGVETWPRLLRLARSEEVPEDTRRAAVFWVGQAAGREATEGLVSVIEDEDALEVREAAVFALSRREDEASVDALFRIARSSPEPELRRKALFWLGQRGDDPRVLALFEEILTGG